MLDLRAGEGPHTFKAAVLKTLSMTPEPASASSSPSAPDPTPATSSAPDPVPATPSAPDPIPATPSSLPNVDVESAGRQENAPVPVGAVESNSNPSAVARLLAERKTRLEKDKQAKDKAEKEDRKAKAEARMQSLAQDPTSTKGKQASYALQERKRQKEARLERDRIKQQIEHDKAERREKEERRKAQAKAEAESREDDVANGSLSTPLDDKAQTFVSSPVPKVPKSSTCAIQIRLFDGSNIRSKFPSDQSLRSHVRKWIDESREDEDVPYTLKQILTPLPNRTLSISEEEQTLQDLGLVPSCTLVMVPVQEYTAAYTNSQGLLSKGASAGYNIVASGAGLVAGALGTFLGLGGVQAEAAGQSGPSPPEQTRNPERRSQDTSSRINVRTLRDQQSDRDPHQLYNGNQVSLLTFSLVSYGLTGAAELRAAKGRR